MRIFFDPSEPRPEKGRLSVGSDGTTWDLSVSQNMWIDPATQTAMLKPLPLTAAWNTTFTGNYARLGLSDFSGSEIAKWEQYGINKSALNKALSMKSTSSASIQTTTSYPANTPMFVKYYRNTSQDSTDDTFLVLGYAVGSGSSVQVKFKESGEISIFKNGVLEGIYDRGSSNAGGKFSFTGTFNPSQKYVNVLLIPFRTRELLVVTDNGICFSHVFKGYDFPNNVTTNPITPAGAFSITVPNGKISIQVARCYFEQTGYIMGPAKTLRYAPTFSDWAGLQYQSYYDYFGNGASNPTLTPSVVSDIAGYPVFNATGSSVGPVRFKMEFSGASGGTNAGLYCGDAFSDPPYSSTAMGSYVDVTNAVQSLELSVSEDGRASINISTRTKLLIKAGVVQPTITGDRPVQIQIKANADWIDIFRGTMSPPKISYETSDKGLDLAVLEFEGVDRFGDFDVSMVPESIPLDYLSIYGVMNNLLPMAGYDPTIYLQSYHSSTFTVPYSANISKGSYSMIPKRGDYVGGLIQQFRDTYLANWFIGWRPTNNTTPPGGYKFQIADPNVVGTTSVMSLYLSNYDAIAYGGHTTKTAYKHTIRSLKRYFESPEANQVAVVGADPTTGKLLYSYYIDAASQDPTYPPVSRPQNWRGRPVQYILSEPSLTTQAGVNQAAQTIFNRIGTGRQIVEWESDFLIVDSIVGVYIPWIGDTVTIYSSSDPSTPGVPPSVLGTYQIVAIPKIAFIKESLNDTSPKIRSCVYRGVYKSI